MSEFTNWKSVSTYESLIIYFNYEQFLLLLFLEDYIIKLLYVVHYKYQFELFFIIL